MTAWSISVRFDQSDPRELLLRGDVRLDGDSPGILEGYERYGDALTEHLIGDFSFALWDGPRRRLLLVRDHFARRPLFYAQHHGALHATNDLPTLLAIPGLAGPLDEHALADFLLFGRNLHAGRTTFANIRRVPAAHHLIATTEGVSIQRYWSIPWRDQPRRIQPIEAQAEFRDVFSRAVRDRVRDRDRVVLSLSGGLDSNAVAATLAQLLKKGEVATDVRALTTVWRTEFHDTEADHAAAAAKAYGFPHEFHVADGCEPFARWDDPRVRGLEPTDEPCSAAFFDFIRHAVAHAPVILTGEGGDPLLYNSHEHFFRLLTRFRLLRFAREAGGYLLARGRLPPLNLRSQLRRALGRPPQLPEYPAWIDPELERRLGLRERWLQVLAPSGPRLHAYRNEAARILDNPAWSRGFEATDPGSTGQPLEWRSPFFDVRVVEFLFSLPPMPHFADKELVRESMRGWMPEIVRRRPKTPLPHDPSARAFGRFRERWMQGVEESTGLTGLVNRRILTDRIRESAGGANDYSASQQAFAVGLGLWLNNR
ncbi:MAG TPA: asparagine synthase-related protein [Thermoanaerobaculia bacterium]|nr:asparagine synthase-related protein [Thermoanaerobaculia bacterium]